MANGVVDIPVPAERVLRENFDAPRTAVLQLGDTYRLERRGTVVLWDVLWIGPLQRLFTRLRIESSGYDAAFAIVHGDVAALRPAELPSHDHRSAARRGFRVYGALPSRETLHEMLDAMRRASVAVVGVEPGTIWSLVYGVRFEPDQFERCVCMVEQYAVRRSAYR